MNYLGYTMLSFFFCLSCQQGPPVPPWFTGKVSYVYTYESPTLDVDSLARVRPSKSIFRYDEHNYQSRFIGKDTNTYYYSGKLNICYAAKGAGIFVDCEDYGEATDSILNYRIYDTDEKILGHSCTIIEYQSKYFWNKYYVSKEAKIAPNTYRKHLAYNWQFYGSKVDGGLILKLEHRFKQFTMKGIATSIEYFKPEEQALEISEELIAKACK